MLRLRYYYQKKGNEEVLQLLSEIEVNQNIPYEIIDLSKNGDYDKDKEKQVYEKDFKPSARILKQKTGKSITKLRSRKHGNYYVSVPGTIAVVGPEGIEWFDIGDKEIINFLKEVLSGGVTFLNKVLKE